MADTGPVHLAADGWYIYGRRLTLFDFPPMFRTRDTTCLRPLAAAPSPDAVWSDRRSRSTNVL